MSKEFLELGKGDYKILIMADNVVAIGNITGETLIYTTSGECQKVSESYESCRRKLKEALETLNYSKKD